MKHTLKLYYFSAFLSGLMVMAAELTASRLLASYFGSSLYVWTNLIGLVMLALAVGYSLGGRLADKRPDSEPYFLLLFWAGIYIALVHYLMEPLMGVLGVLLQNLSRFVTVGSFISIIVLLVPPMFFLAMIVPYTLKLVAHEMKDIGEYSGRVSMVSTAGSLIGTFLPAFVLVPLLGVRASFVFIGFVLMFYSALALKRVFLFAASIVVLALLFLPQSSEANFLYSDESSYGHVFVKEHDGEFYLHVDHQIGIQSVYDPDTPITEEYYAYFGVLPRYVDSPESVLILGHAGGSFTRVFNTFYPELSVTGVEIDPAITRAAEAVMGLRDLDVEIIHGDARAYVSRTDARYDLILVDAYNGLSIPSHLATEEFFLDAKAALNDGGVMALNIAAPDSEFKEQLTSSMFKQFEHAALVPMPKSYNTMVLAWDGERSFNALPQELSDLAEYVSEQEVLARYEGASTFTDDKMARVELLNERMMQSLYERF